MLNYLKKIKTNNATLAISITMALIAASTVHDFQVVQNYTINSPVKGVKKILTIREFDRYDTNIPSDAIKISEVTHSHSQSKKLLSILAIISSVIALKLSINEENEADLSAYKLASEQDKIKVDIDFDRAFYDQLAKAKAEIRTLELHEELLENSKYQQILRQRVNLENGIDENDDDDTSQEDNTHLFVEANNGVTYYFTDADIATIKKQMSQGKSIKYILETLKVGYDSSHPQWVEIKDELVKKLQQG